MGCEAWSFTMCDKYRLGVFESWLLRKIFGPKGVEVRGGWTELHEVLHSRNTIKMLNVTRIGENRTAYSGFVGKHGGGKRPGTLGLGKNIILKRKLKRMEGWTLDIFERIRKHGGLL